MNRNLFLRWAGFLLALTTLNACDKDDDSQTPQGQYSSGAFIINEGLFNNGNASISFFNRTTKEVIPNVFETENNRSLGDVAQSLTIHEDKAYIVVNNSNKIEVVDAGTFKSIGAIENKVEQCRYLAAAGKKAYVTSWGLTGNPSVVVVDLNTLQVTKNIPVGKGPEGITLVGNEAFVANSGGYTNDNTISVINTTTDEVSQTISVGDHPTQLVTDANGKLWVLCRGKYGDFSNSADLGTKAELIRITPATKAIEARMDVGTLQTSKPGNLSINREKNTLYFTLAGGVHAVSINATSIPANNPIVKKSFYGIGIDPVENILYGADALNYKQNGWVYRFTNQGEKIDSFRVQLIPNGFAFQ